VAKTFLQVTCALHALGKMRTKDAGWSELRG
jgi:hypothetical protein